MNASQEGFVMLASRATAILDHIQKHIDPDEYEESDDIHKSLESFHKCVCPHTLLDTYLALIWNRLIENIQRDVQRELGRSRTSRFFHHASISTTLKKRMQDLEDARERFNVRCSPLPTYSCHIQHAGVIDGVPNISQKERTTTSKIP